MPTGAEFKDGAALYRLINGSTEVRDQAFTKQNGSPGECPPSEPFS
jgi:hypothetical protein